MRAAQIVAPGQVEVVETPVPTPAPGYARVRPELMTICGSDLRQVYNRPPETYPLAVGLSGHEIVGQVEELAPREAGVPDTDGIRTGDRVLALMPEVENGRNGRFYLPSTSLRRCF